MAKLQEKTVKEKAVKEKVTPEKVTPKKALQEKNLEESSKRESSKRESSKRKRSKKETPTGKGIADKRLADKTSSPQPFLQTDDDEPKKKRRFPKPLIYALTSLGIFTLVALAFRPAPIAVEVGQVTQGPLQVTIDAEGKTRVQERYVVSAPVAGRLQRIRLKAGDRVTAGEAIAQIDPLPLNAQVRTAQARLQQLQAELAGVDTQRPKAQAIAQAEAQMRSAQARQQAIAADVEEATAALEQARRDRIRAQNLAESGAITRQEKEAAELTETREAQALENRKRQLESAIAEVTSAQESIALLRAEQRDPDYLVRAYNAQIAGAEAELANLADEANRTTISAPVSGSVLRIPESSARFVSAGEPLITLGDSAELELVIDVLSADAVKIKPGDKILVDQWGGPEPLRATVQKIEPAAFTEVSALGVEEQRVNVIGTFDANNPSLSSNPLGDGYRIEANIVVWESESTLKVPVSALARCDTAWCVFKVEEGRAYQEEIEIGQQTPQSAAVISGLAVGEAVILHPSEQIESGRRVR